MLVYLHVQMNPSLAFKTESYVMPRLACCAAPTLASVQIHPTTTLESLKPLSPNPEPELNMSQRPWLR